MRLVDIKIDKTTKEIHYIYDLNKKHHKNNPIVYVRCG